MPSTSRALLLIVFLACGPGRGGGLDNDDYQLIGKIKLEEGKFRQSALPMVFLDGSSIPYAVHTLADVNGSFKFKNLHPDFFTLSVYIPRVGQFKQTVEISPGLADSRKRVFIDINFRPNLEGKLLGKVSSNQLTIPEKAVKEYNKAREKLGKRDTEAAITHLKKALDLAPQFCQAWNQLGTLAYKARDFRLAESYFREALNHDPEYYPSMVNLGGALLSQRRFEEALPLNISAVRTMPDDALAHVQMGLNYYYLGQFAEAEKYLEQAISLDSGHFSLPQLTLADIYMEKKDFTSAARTLAQFLELHPDAQEAPAAQRQLERIRELIRDSKFEIRD